MVREFMKSLSTQSGTEINSTNIIRFYILNYIHIHQGRGWKYLVKSENLKPKKLSVRSFHFLTGWGRTGYPCIPVKPLVQVVHEKFFLYQMEFSFTKLFCA